MLFLFHVTSFHRAGRTQELPAQIFADKAPIKKPLKETYSPTAAFLGYFLFLSAYVDFNIDVYALLIQQLIVRYVKHPCNDPQFNIGDKAPAAFNALDSVFIYVKALNLKHVCKSPL